MYTVSVYIYIYICVCVYENIYVYVYVYMCIWIPLGFGLSKITHLDVGVPIGSPIFCAIQAQLDSSACFKETKETKLSMDWLKGEF